MDVLVSGGGGFIAGHLVRRLLDEGHHVRAVDIKPLGQWLQPHREAENWDSRDLRERDQAINACNGAAHVYNLAADMGGIGYITTHKVDCMRSTLINLHLLEAAATSGVQRYFLSSSACAYNTQHQDRPDVCALREEDAYPAMPEDGYGWEKLYAELTCQAYQEEDKIEARIARFHNIFGTHETVDGGREKAPAALCRKVIEAKLSGRHEISIWGDGNQTRSFCWVGDCVDGVRRLMGSEFSQPINIGSSELVTINQLVDIIEKIAEVKLDRHYDLDAPQGVRGRNSDNRLCREVLGWEPSTPLEVGIERLYKWLWDEMASV